MQENLVRDADDRTVTEILSHSYNLNAASEKNNVRFDDTENGKSYFEDPGGTSRTDDFWTPGMNACY